MRVLVPTWFTGTSAGHAYLVSPDLLNPEKYFIVIVDALANGVSISPSNSETQPDGEFPNNHHYRHGREPAPVADRGAGHPVTAWRDGPVDGRHAGLRVGRAVSRFCARRPWRQSAAHACRLMTSRYGPPGTCCWNSTGNVSATRRSKRWRVWGCSAPYPPSWRRR